MQLIIHIVWQTDYIWRIHRTVENTSHSLTHRLHLGNTTHILTHKITLNTLEYTQLTPHYITFDSLWNITQVDTQKLSSQFNRYSCVHCTLYSTMHDRTALYIPSVNQRILSKTWIEKWQNKCVQNWLSGETFKIWQCPCGHLGRLFCLATPPQANQSHQ